MGAIGGLDIATITGLACLRDGLITTQTLRNAVKGNFLADTKKFGTLDPMVDGAVGRKFRDGLLTWLIDNEIVAAAIEAPIPTNNTRVTEEIDAAAEWAGQARRRVQHDAGSMSSSYRINGMSFLALSICSELNIPVWMVAQSTWRKEFLGVGIVRGGRDAAKEMALQQCKKLGIEVSSKDAAEAAGIVTWLDRTLNPNTARRRAEDLFANPGHG